MSRARGLVSMAVATAIGVGTGIAIFDPAFKEEAEQKQNGHTKDFDEQHSPSAEEQVRKTEEAVANAGGATTIPKQTARWAEVQKDQFGETKETFEWNEVQLDQYSADNDS